MEREYNNIFFWEDTVQNNIYMDRFEKGNITESSVICFNYIIDRAGITISNWLRFPDIFAFLGFFNYIYVPTALCNFLTEKYNGYIVMDNNDLIDMIEKAKPSHFKKMIPNLKTWLNAISRLWYIDDKNICIFELKELINSLNERWNRYHDKFSAIKVFGSPREVGDYVVEYYDSDYLSLDDMKRALGVSKDEWFFIYDNVYTNTFINKRFTDMLNNKLPTIL